MKRTELGATSLGTAFIGFIGRNLRARYWVMEPGGVIPHHCHDDRPILVYLLTGNVKETKWFDGKTQINEYKAGDAIPEGRSTRHWWVNPLEFDKTVTIIAVDLANIDHTRPPTSGTDGGERTVGAWFNLADEFPHIGGLRGIEARGSALILQLGDATEVTNHTRRPRFAFVIEGAVTEHRSDSVEPISHAKGGSSHASGTTWSYWVNDGSGPATIYVYEFIDCERVGDGDCRPTGHTPHD